jgi:hypothetical protein
MVEGKKEELEGGGRQLPPWTPSSKRVVVARVGAQPKARCRGGMWWCMKRRLEDGSGLNLD